MEFGMKVKNILRFLYYYKYYSRFKEYGENVILSRGGIILHPDEITFGNNVFIASGFRISASQLVFGNNIMAGPNLVIETDNHKYDCVGKTMFENSDDKVSGYVTIEDDVWIGANVTILQNVSIGEGSIVGACSLVNKSIPPYSLTVGLPAKPIKPRFKKDDLIKHLEIVGSKYSFDEIMDQYVECKIS